MRIAVKVLRLADGRPQDVGPLAPRAHIIERQCTDRFQQLRNQPGAFLHPAAIGGEPRIFTELLQVELLEEAQPLLVAGDANKQLTPILRRKHLLDRPRTLTRRHRRHLAAGRGDARHMRRHQECGAPNNELPTRRPRPVVSRSRNAACTATTPNTAPMLSITEAPARNGCPGPKCRSSHQLAMADKHWGRTTRGA